jgi:putative endonuclease
MNLYILRSRSSGRYYVGATNDLIARLAQHNTPEMNPSRWTRSRGPWEMVFHKKYVSAHSALLAERYVKKMKSAKFIEKLLSGEYALPSFGE